MDNSLYGRKWELSVQCSDGTFLTVGNDGISGVESLKCTFQINYPGYEGWYFSEFNIWNPMPSTSLKIIEEGAQVFFSAGYGRGKYGQIFGGRVFQAFSTRENVTDYKLTLLCVDGSKLFKDNFTAFSRTAGYTYSSLLNDVAQYSQSPISMGQISNYIKDIQFPRGVTVFGSPSAIGREVCRSNNLQMFMKDDKWQFTHLSDIPEGTALEIDPSSGLIGTPEQTDYGISFRTLLDPTLQIANPPKWVKIDLSKINVKQQRAVIGKDLVGVLQLETSPWNGYFKVGGVVHSGDTRGQEWYTDVVGYSFAGKKPLQLEPTVPGITKNPRYDANGN